MYLHVIPAKNILFLKLMCSFIGINMGPEEVSSEFALKLEY